MYNGLLHKCMQQCIIQKSSHVVYTMYYAILLYLCMQVNAVLLTISLGSLAKSQLGKTTSEMTPEKNERRKEFMEVGK